MNDYNKLTDEERIELGDRLASGDISCAFANSDWFNLKLSSGRKVCGAYKHDSELGDFIRLAVVG